MTGFIRTYAEPDSRLQEPFEVAVIMPTILRPELKDALRSVFAQTIQGRIHVLIGIDRPTADLSLLDAACEGRPPNCVVQVYYPGYSTSVRYGGLSPARDGGVLRCVLSYLANSPYIAYLDDDNWWRPDHLQLLRAAMVHADWAFSLRWFVHPTSRHLRGSVGVVGTRPWRVQSRIRRLCRSQLHDAEQIGVRAGCVRVESAAGGRSDRINSRP